MKGFSYREQDYAFGQSMLTLRLRIGLTQAKLAEILGVSRKAISNWERGNSYPQVEHLKQFIALAIQHQAFPTERIAEEVHAIWQSAHQRVLFDETWLATLIPSSVSSPPVQPIQGETAKAATEEVAETSPIHRLDWGDALAVPAFYGRAQEIDLLTNWVVADRCRVVCVQGLGGIGKSALVTNLMHRIADHFEVVIWRSMRDLPTSEELIEELLQVLLPQSLSGEPMSLLHRQEILLEQMRKTRVLLVLDNFEAVLEEGAGTGKMRTGFEGLGRVLRLATETEHQSCILLTSREKPAFLAPLESSQAPVRVLRLGQLDTDSCQKLLAEKGLRGSTPDWAQLIEVYTGNPLALKIVAETILDLFEGENSLFLKQGEVIFGGVRDLLGEQFARLSRLEQSLLLWLAILREPSNINALQEVLVTPVPTDQLLEALNTLYRHSLIEHGQKPGNFALQSVVMEFLTTWLITHVTAEIQNGDLNYLINQGLELALAREYVRQTQERMIVIPILTRLRSTFPQSTSLEEQFLGLLRRLASGGEEQGYGPANLVTLLRIQKGNLRSLDLSGLALRGAYLQGIEMQDTNLSNAFLQDCNITEAFGAISTVAISNSGQYWAASIGRGEVRVWETVGERLHWIWQIHKYMIRSLAFSPDGRRLAIGSLDGMIQLMDVASGDVLWSSSHTHNVNNLAFSPDGNFLASTGNDSTVRLWDSQLGTLLQSLPHPGPVFAVAWSPDGYWLASGDTDGAVRLWEVKDSTSAACTQTFIGHTDWVDALCFSPDSRLLASSGYDGKVILWDIANGALQLMFAGQMDRVQHLAWSSNGKLVAFSSIGDAIWLWEVEQEHPRSILQGHSALIEGLAFIPDSDSLLSGSDDGSLRLWDVAHGRMVRLIQGYTSVLYDLDWSPDGTRLATGGANTEITLWEVAKKTPSKIWHDLNWVIYGVGWSPDGKWLASSGWGQIVQLWDLTSDYRDEIREPKCIFYGLDWSPDGEHLACGTYLHGILVYEVNTKTRRWMGREYSTRFARVAWNPDRIHLAGGADDGYIYIWDASAGKLLQRLKGHLRGVKSVAWSPDGEQLASAGEGNEGGELKVWDSRLGKLIQSLKGYAGIVHSVAWGISKEILVSGGSDGKLRWWNIQTGETLHEQEAHQGRVQSLRRSPEGTRLASCGDDGVVLLWDLDTAERMQILRQDRPYEQLNLSGISGLDEVQREDLHTLGAVEEPNKED